MLALAWLMKVSMWLLSQAQPKASHFIQNYTSLKFKFKISRNLQAYRFPHTNWQTLLFAVIPITFSISRLLKMSRQLRLNLF